LGWVATKFVAEGHPYDEGYFYEYDHDLRPEERFRVVHVDRSPEFNPEIAPKLNPETWPEVRVLKGGYNYSVDYVRHVIAILYELLGVNGANDVIGAAMRLLAAQFSAELARATGEESKDCLGVARLFGAIFTSYRNPVSISGDEQRAVLTIGDFILFKDVPNESLRRSVFEFFAMAVRVRNGHLAIVRYFDTKNAAEVWTITDEGKWLW